MTVAILDTTVIVHLFRKNPAALTWLRAQQTTLSITSTTWMEVMVGVASKRAQEETHKLLSGLRGAVRCLNYTGTFSEQR